MPLHRGFDSAEIGDPLGTAAHTRGGESITPPLRSEDRCDCADWKANIPKVNAPVFFMHARNPHTYKGYDGVAFRFCPWCAPPSSSA